MSKRLETLIATNDRINYQNREIILSVLKKEQSKTKKSKPDKKRFWFSLLEMFLPFLFSIIEKIQRENSVEGLYYLEMTKNELFVLTEEAMYNENVFEADYGDKEEAKNSLFLKIKELRKIHDEDHISII